jgi:hypothetical protein
MHEANEVLQTFTGQDRDDFEHLKRDMWFGNGKKSVTVRIELMEECMERLEEKLAGINAKFWAIILLLAGAIITTTTAIINHAITAAPIANHSSMF